MFDFTQNVRLIAEVAEIEKDNKGHIGIAIGGGVPTCPCLYIVQIFENSPVKRNNLIGLGDEIVAINGESVRNLEKSTVASLIREAKGVIKLSFNRLQFDFEKGQTLDILLKKFKHRFVDAIDDQTADALGLSRAILCNDALSKLRERLDTNQQFYKALIKRADEMAKCYQQVSQTQSCLSAIFAEMATKETDDALEATNFNQTASIHKLLSQEHILMAQKLNETVRALKCHAEAAIPDVKQSLAKYLDAKYEYLSFCLRVKELEDEEADFAIAGEPLNRMETGNYEYRAMLKCRENNRINFVEKRKQVAVKIELLDEKHVRELALQLKALMETMKDLHEKCRDGFGAADKEVKERAVQDIF